MARQVVDPLLTKRKNRRPIGYLHEEHLCLNCAPQWMTDRAEPLVEGDDAGMPFACHRCGNPLRPDETTQVET